jgi:DNA-directed RNA polymerase specialized sigma24 family protein
MLEDLSIKDKQWRDIAFNICKNKSLADDLVNDMYIKLHKVKKQINDFYVIIVIRNLYFDYLKQQRLKVDIDKFYNLEIDDYKFEIDDEQLDILSKLNWIEKGYLEMSFDMSLRKMQEELNTNYGYIYRVIKKAKEKI